MNWTPCDTLPSGSSTVIGPVMACRLSCSARTPQRNCTPRICSRTTTSATGGADGRKPYMVYSQTGGTSYAGENAATSGWTDREWNAQSCGSRLVRCIVPDLAESITDHQQSMMYDDAHADWGHRDNILGESHRAVNIGVASNGRRVTFVQHFEGGAVEADGPPVLNANGVLSLSLTKREAGIAIGGLASIYYDPPPTPKTPSQIDALDSYCLGGGVHDELPGF